MCDCDGRFAVGNGGLLSAAGLDALLSMLDRRKARITFNVVADLCRTDAQCVGRILSAGHEIACHGWKHERPRELSSDELDLMLRNALADFATLGLRPRGFRSPESAWSLALLKRLPEHGFVWNAERDPAARPYRIIRGLIRIPVRTDDWDLFDQGAEPAALLQRWTCHLPPVGQAGTICFGLHEWTLGRFGDFAGLLENWIVQTQGRVSTSLTTLSDIATAWPLPAGRCAAPRPSSGLRG